MVENGNNNVGERMKVDTKEKVKFAFKFKSPRNIVDLMTFYTTLNL